MEGSCCIRWVCKEAAGDVDVDDVGSSEVEASPLEEAEDVAVSVVET